MHRLGGIEDPLIHFVEIRYLTLSGCGEPVHGDQWWFVHTDGLFFSANGGVTPKKVLDSHGKPTH